MLVFFIDDLADEVSHQHIIKMEDAKQEDDHAKFITERFHQVLQAHDVMPKTQHQSGITQVYQVISYKEQPVNGFDSLWLIIDNTHQVYLAIPIAYLSHYNSDVESNWQVNDVSYDIVAHFIPVLSIIFET